MSTVAWDGRTLAADCQYESGGCKRRTSKLIILPTMGIAWTGIHECGLLLAQWYQEGAYAQAWPKFQREEHWTRLIVANSEGKVYVFEQEPIAQRLWEDIGAWGSGRDYAYGALACGASATRAVEIACQFDIYSGLGVEQWHRPL